MGWKIAKAAGKILLFAVATLAAALAFMLPLTFANPDLFFTETEDFASPTLLTVMLFILVATLIAAGAMLWLFDRRELASIGLRSERVVSDSVFGFAFGAAALLVGVLAAWVVGVAQPSASLPAYSAVPLAISLATALASAASEEVMFRGYVLHELLSKFTARTAVLVSSVLFAVAHIDAVLDDAMGAIGFVNLVLAGVLMALAVLKTGTLWLAIGLHTGWNFTLGPVLGWIVSGVDVTTGSQLFTLHGPPFMTGGAFGFEGSVPGLLGTLLGIAILLPLPDRIPAAVAAR